MSQLPAEGSVQQRLFQCVERGEFALVERFQALGFTFVTCLYPCSPCNPWFLNAFFLTSDFTEGTDRGRIEGLSQLPAEGSVQQRLFQLVERGEFALVEGFEALGFFAECFEVVGDTSLLSQWRQSKLKVLDLLPADVRHSNPGLDAQNVPSECRASDEIHQESVVEFR